LSRVSDLTVAARRLVRAAGSAAADVPGVARAMEWVVPNRPGRLTILMYHRVDHPQAEPDLDPSLLSATPGRFAAQMEHVAGRCTPISLDTLLAVQRGDEPLPPRAVMVTFDDAYRDFDLNAWPTLRRLGVPVTVFVPTAYPDSAGPGFWWDRLHRAFTRTAHAAPLPTAAGTLDMGGETARRTSAARLRDHLKRVPHTEAMDELERILMVLGVPESGVAVLGWERLAVLAREGVTLAPHSRTHPLLNRIGHDTLVDELVGSAEDLRARVGSSPPAVAYPSGGYSSAVIRTVAEAGFRVAFTTRRGSVDIRRPAWLELSRCNIGRRTSVGLMRAQIAAAPRGDLTRA
jgi:peptidoglycan/xylan/chitin deacetylase (PgdA/CDA1 family)